MTETDELFNNILIEAIDEGLLILSESGREVVYFHLHKFYGLKKEDIPKNLVTFLNCIRKIFGSGAFIIEKSIIRTLYKKIGLEFSEKEEYDFIKCLNALKEHFRKGL
jgi:hypothetical protein